jgi:uncharacterized membrane protein YhdT
MDDLERTDYDVSAIEEDLRFLQAKKEFFVVQCITITQIFIVTLICYSLSGNDRYVWGYPLWYAYATIFCLVVAVVSAIYALGFMKKSKLDAVADNTEEKEEN